MSLLYDFFETMYYIFKLKFVKDILARDGYFENKPDWFIYTFIVVSVLLLLFVGVNLYSLYKLYF